MVSSERMNEGNEFVSILTIRQSEQRLNVFFYGKRFLIFPYAFERH